MLDVEGDFPRPGTTLAAKPVDDAAIGDRDEPRTERPRRIVGVPHGVHREQHLLHRVLDVAGNLKVPRGDRTKIRRDVLEQAPIGFPVAALRASHIDGPVELSRGRSLLPRSRRRGRRRRGPGDESQVGTAIVGARGHARNLWRNKDTPGSVSRCRTKAVCNLSSSSIEFPDERLKPTTNMRCPAVNPASRIDVSCAGDRKPGYLTEIKKRYPIVARIGQRTSMRFSP